MRSDRNALVELTIAVVVRSDAGDFVAVRIRRSVAGDVYVMLPGRAPKDWNPHSSYHASGQHHSKAHNRKFVVRQRQPLDASFTGRVNVVTTPLVRGSTAAKGVPYQSTDFDTVMLVHDREIDADPVVLTTYISVDLLQPGKVLPAVPGTTLDHRPGLQRPGTVACGDVLQASPFKRLTPAKERRPGLSYLR